MPKWASSIGLIVPPNPENEPALARWRWFVFISIAVLAFALAAHIAWASGVIPGSGFALQEDVLELKEELRRVETNIDLASENALDAQIYRIRKDQCEALANNNGEAASMAELRIRRRVNDWERLTGRIYRRPSCEEVGVIR